MKKYYLLPVFALGFIGCSSLPRVQEHSIKSLPMGDSEIISTTISTNEATISTPVINWWENGKDQNLNMLVKEVLKNNPDLKVAELNMEKSNYALQSTKRANLSPIGLTASGMQSHLLDMNVDTHLPIRDMTNSKDMTLGTIGLKAEYTIDLWGKYKALSQKAQYMKLASALQKNWLEVNISSMVTELYANYILMAQEENVLERKVAIAKRVQGFQNTLFKAGTGQKNDVLTAENSYLTAQKALMTIKNNKQCIRNSILALNGSTDSPYIDSILKSVDKNPKFKNFISIPKSVDSDLVINRPDIKYYLALIDSQREELKSDKADFYPRFSILGQTEFQTLDIKDLVNAKGSFLGIGPSLYLPILNRNQLKQKYNIAGTDLNIFIEDYNKNLIKSYLDVNNNLNNLRTSKKSKDIEDKIYNNANKKYKNDGIMYKSGHISEYQLVMSENELLDAKLDLIKSEYEVYTNQVKLIQSLGGYYKN